MKRFVPVLAYLLLVLVSYRPIIDSDMYLGVANGTYILKHRSIPFHEVFSWSAQGRPYIPYEWLSQTWIAWLYQNGSIPLVSLYVSVLFSTCLFLLYSIARSVGHNRWFSGTVSLVTGVFLYEFFTPRPYVLGMVFFIMTLRTVFRFLHHPEKPFRLWWSVPLVYLWSNTHTSFIFAPYLFFSFAILVPRVRRIFLAVAIGQILVTLLPPLSYKSYQLFWQIISDMPFIQSFYDEWKPIVSHVWYMSIYMTILIASGIVFIRGRSLGFRAIPFLPFVIAPFWSLRHFPWAMVSLFVIFVHSISSQSKLNTYKRTIIILTSLLAIGLVLGRKYSLRDANWHLPQTALSFLQEHKLSGRMLNDMPVGGYLASELYPDYQIFIDGRAEVFACCELRDLALLNIRSMQSDMYSFLNKHSFSYVIVPTSTYNPLEFSTIGKIADMLMDDPDWRLVYVSDMMRILVKNDGKNDAVFHEFGATTITPYRLTQYRTGKEQEAMIEYQRMLRLKESGIALGGLGQVHLALNNILEAESAFTKATSVNPRLGRPYVGLAKIAIQKKETDRAISYLTQALTLAPYIGEGYLLLGTLYNDSGKSDQAIQILKKGLNYNIDLISRQKIVGALSQYEQ